VVERLRSLGYLYVTVDLAGFRSGSLNEGLGRAAPNNGENPPA
jgi:PP-loop superfamily ATP-utilizing enzyme